MIQHARPMAGYDDTPPMGVGVRGEGTKRTFIIKIKLVYDPRGRAATTKAELLGYPKVPVCALLSSFAKRLPVLEI